jgi:cytidylate kinase
MHDYRTITVARQYGSGGGPIARILANKLGWDLLDHSLITRIAQSAHVDAHVCEQLDEAVDTWLHRLTKRAFGSGAFEAAAPAEVFDSDTMASVARQLIEEAARIGNCVIVGRGGQCILRGRPDVFHAFVYAPLEERIRRVKQELGPRCATPEMIHASDKERAAYVKHHYQCEWCDPQLYHAMFSATLGDETVADAILTAMHVTHEPSHA